MIHIAFCLSICFFFHHKVIFLFVYFLIFVYVFILLLLSLFFLSNFTYFCDAFFVLVLFRLLLWSLFQKDTFLFIRGRLFICVVIIIIKITFIFNNLYTYKWCLCWSHYWQITKLEMPGRRSWLMRFTATALSLLMLLGVSMTWFVL